MLDRLMNRTPTVLLLIGATLATLLAALMFMQAGPEGASAAFPGSNGKIVFTSHRSGNQEIYSMNSDGSNSTRLTYTAIPPGFSYTISSDAAWSPDGTHIAFATLRNGNMDIYIMNADGSNQTQLTSNGSADRSPSWSPDGTKILFSSYRTSTWQVYVMDADGSGQTQLTSVGYSGGASWSPDGSKIAFESVRDSIQGDIYVMNADGSNETRITDGPTDESSPDWSPDGTKIAYSVWRSYNNHDVYVMGADGSNPTDLTETGANDFEPAWSPDGTHIAFTSNRGGNWDIYVMNSEGGQQTNVTNNPAEDSSPDWQPVCEAGACTLPFPIPTATPCPTDGCPTPTNTVPIPTSTPTPTPHVKSNGIDFSIGTDTSHGASNTCDSSGAPAAVCQVPMNGLFKVSLYLSHLPTGMQGGKYQGFDSAVQYTGVTQAGTTASVDMTPWPDCFFTGRAFQPGVVLAGCAVGIGSPGSTYTGRLLTVEFRCVADGTVTLAHGTGGGETHLVDNSLMNFAEGEGTTESLTIDCNESSVPTPTPGPASVDFSIGTGVSGGALSSCDSAGAPTNVCQVPTNDLFKVSLSVNQLPAGLANGKYLGYDSKIQYSGVTQAGTTASVDFTPWPGCSFTGLSFQPPAVLAGCGVGIGSSGSNYVGKLLTEEFRCVADGERTLVHGISGVGADLVDGDLNQFAEGQGTTESLTIDCVEPLPYPGDTDGDGCPDMKEVGPSPMTGGQRSFLNQWDYFDPTRDGLGRISDVLAVVDQYHADEGQPGYTQNTDRTLLGPNAWNLGPPNGQQRIDDILDAVYQYHHDCS